jgi:peptide deformylase
LSYKPDTFGEVERALFVTVEFFDENGDRHEIFASNFLADCFQHEIDHLDGISFMSKTVDGQTYSRDEVIKIMNAPKNPGN